MKVSGTGAVVGAIVGCAARATVVTLNILWGADDASVSVVSLLAPFVLPSAAIGLLVGAMAGAVGKPLLGAGVGAVLSGLVFELFAAACASLIGTFSPKTGAAFLAHTVIYALEMALAGAVAGAAGGWATRTAPAHDPGANPGDGPRNPSSGPEPPNQHAS